MEGVRTKDGIIYTNTKSSKMYISLFYHRGSGDEKYKSFWCIPPDIEFAIFCDADDGDWRDVNGHYWGIYDEGRAILGINNGRVCKFPSNGNLSVPWHGFPVSPQKGENNTPPIDFVQRWIDDKIIDKRIGRNIQRRKI
ncbi:MAG: hypothetical protein WCD86_27340 [Ktedonobacteraceae bacterium]